MEFEEPEGRTTDQKELAPLSSSSSDQDSDTDTDSDTDPASEPSGYILVRLQIKKRYKTILSEEELIP